jgi:hypothetical protein
MHEFKPMKFSNVKIQGRKTSHIKHQSHFICFIFKSQTFSQIRKKSTRSDLLSVNRSANNKTSTQTFVSNVAHILLSLISN